MLRGRVVELLTSSGLSKKITAAPEEESVQHCTVVAFRPNLDRSRGARTVRIEQFIAAATMHYRVMKAAVTKAAVMRVGNEQVLLVRCPTCGARAREKCELNTGLPRTDPHPARRLAAEKR